MAYIDELLRMPVSDITEGYAVQPDEVRLVVDSLEALLGKCLYCVRVRLAPQLDIFLALLAQATILQPERVVRGLSAKAEEGTCLDLLCELVAQMLSRVNAALRLETDVEQLFEVVQAVCGDARLKDRLGGVLGRLLLDYMHDGRQHGDDYRVHRGCASALITLLRGSSSNKNRCSAECGRIAACIEQSADFFFQMQCIEILFRLHTHNRTVLAQAKMNDFLRRSITGLPNDATLLLSIQNLLDTFNAEFNSARVVPFTIVRMEVDGVEVCSHTTMYFSPLLLVVILPGGTGDNFTIPFEHIRSVKLSKDHKLGLRLNVVPPKLALNMSIEDGRDTLHVFLTQSTLARLRSCNVHQWIADRKRNAPRPAPAAAVVALAAAPAPAPKARAPSAAAAAAAASADGGYPITERQQPNRPSPRKTHREGREADGPQAAVQGLDEVHRAAAVKAARNRDEQRGQLQQAAGRVEDELEDLRRLSARDRDSFEAIFREGMTAVRRSEAALKDSAADCVHALNGELEDVQALGALLKAEADRLRERLAKSLGKSEGAEEACLVRVKRLVDAQMLAMEASLVSVLAEANPLAGVSQYLAQRIGDLAAPDTKSKARRLEYS